MPRNVRQYVIPVKIITPITAPLIFPMPPLKDMPPTTQAAMASSSSLTISRAGVRSKGLKECAESVEDRGHDENSQGNLEHADAAYACRLGVAAYGIHIFAEDGFIPDKPRRNNGNDRGNNQLGKSDHLSIKETQNPTSAKKILDTAVKNRQKFRLSRKRAVRR